MYHLQRASSLVSTASRWQQRHISRAIPAACCVSKHNPVEITRQQQRLFSSTKGVGITVARKGKGTGYCYGCGASLVQGPAGSMATTEKRTDYWSRRRQELKISKLKHWALCPRCQTLSNQKHAHDFVESYAPDSKMTLAFREEVSKIRHVPNAVVVLCVDAVNVSGTLIKTIRNYVGGNPILVAITRCDLLPPYMLQNVDKLKRAFSEQCRDISPANVYLCSVERDYIRETGGVGALADDLWKHLNGREPYIVGAANLGKSTLTDVLISVFIKRGERQGGFRDRLSRKRLLKLRESRVTKSALPGTTLQNIRVPCFADHTQALWDTPGLLLDESVQHFPIRNFRQLRAQKPHPIEPRIQHVMEKSFCILICQEGDFVPLMRIEVRLKKKAQGEGPFRMAWNSTLNLDVHITDIEQAREAEKERQKKQLQVQNRRRSQQEQRADKKSRHDNDSQYTSEKERLERKEEKEKRHAERKRAYEQRLRQEQQELGMKEWKRRQKEKEAEREENVRMKSLAKLHQVNEVICDGGVGMDIDVANFGWLSILPPRPAMIKTFAPSTGVRVVNHSALALPSDWGHYEPYTSDKTNKEISNDERINGNDSDDDDYEDEEYGYDEYEEYKPLYEEYDDAVLDYDEDLDYDGWDGDVEYGRSGGGSQYYERGSRARGGASSSSADHWAKYSGEHVGWRFDADTRWSNGRLQEGWNPVRKDEERSAS